MVYFEWVKFLDENDTTIKLIKNNVEQIVGKFT